MVSVIRGVKVDGLPHLNPPAVPWWNLRPGDVFPILPNGIADSVSLDSRAHSTFNKMNCITFSMKVPMARVQTAFFLSSQMSESDLAVEHELITDFSNIPGQVVKAAGFIDALPHSSSSDEEFPGEEFSQEDSDIASPDFEWGRQC